MNTKEFIELNYSKALGQADRLEQAAEKLNMVSQQQFQDTIQNLSADWTGTGASSYIAKGNRLVSDMNATAREIHRAAEDLRVMAKRLYDAEMAALSVIKTKSY